MKPEAGAIQRFFKKRGGWLLQVGIVLVWVFMMGALVERTFLRPEALRVTPALAREGLRTGEEWWGIYLRDVKIGYATTSQGAEGNKVRVREKLWLKLIVLHTPQSLEQTLEYRADERLAVESFSFSIASGLIQFNLAGRVDAASAPRRLLLQVHSGGKTTEHSLPLKEPLYILSQSKLYFLSQGLAPGKKYRIPAFDPATLSTAEMIAEVEGTERLAIGGEERELFRVREEFRGMQVKSWIDCNGEVWKEESPTGMLLLKESRETAMHKNWGRGKVADLIALTAVPADRTIEAPRTLRLLRARLKSAALAGLEIAGDRQSWWGDEVVVRREEFPVPASERRPLPEDERREALKPTPFIQSEDAEIKAQAEAIVAGARDAAEKAARICAWVFQEVEKRPVVAIPSALEVLKQKKGDCNEHAALYTALARAAGIPARIQAGLVYQEGKFFYHAWAQVYLGKWISVDPVLNQIPADAAHIRLMTGDLDRQLAIGKVIGRLKVEILEAR